MSTITDYKSVLEAASQWSADERASLAQDLLQLSGSEGLAEGVRRRANFARALGLGRSKGAPPTEEEVRGWIEEHRMEKYGK